MTKPAESYPTPAPADVLPAEAVVDSADPSLDSAALNRIVQTAAEPGVYFGRGLELTEYDREQLAVVGTKVEAILAPSYEDPNWQAFVKLAEEGASKGVLVSFATHEGTNVPTWCVNGGKDAPVSKVKRQSEHGEAAGIQVPDGVFNLFHWHNTVQNLRRYAGTSDEALKGTSPASLGRDLKQLGWFYKNSAPPEPS